MSVGSVGTGTTSSTVSSGAPLIQFTDLTGLNTSSIIDALVQAASEPITLMQQEVAAEQAKETAWEDVNTQLMSLATAVTNLQLQANMTAMAASSSDPGVATATANANAQAGTYTLTVDQIATGTTTQSAGTLAGPPSATVALDSAGFAVTPTSGYFTIDGTTFSVDAATDSLDTVINEINSASIGVTAAIDPSDANLLQLTSSSTIQIGSLGDTSNFLSATNLLTSVQTYSSSSGQYTATSTSDMAKINPGAVLDDAGFSTTLTSTTVGQFSINGVTINYNTTTESLDDVINAINSSNAGVSASYDAVADKVDLTATTTGSQSIALSDISGNLLQALKITSGAGATQTLGQNAEFTLSGVNGGQPIYSTSNQVTGALPNVTLNLAGPGTTTLNVSADTSAALSTIQAFVTAYNTANADMNGYLGQGDTLEGDTDLQQIQQSLFNVSFTQVAGQPTGYSSLAQIGITTDQNTGNMEVNTATLQAALNADPQAVFNLFNNSANGVATTLNNLLNSYTAPATGQISLEEQGYTNNISNLNQSITNMQEQVSLYQSQLEQEYTNMETTIESLQSTDSYLSSFVGYLNALSASAVSSGSSSTGSSSSPSSSTS